MFLRSCSSMFSSVAKIQKMGVLMKTMKPVFGMQCAEFGKLAVAREKRARKLAKDEWKNQLPIEPMDIDKLCLSIDTTLTPEQRTYVDMLKKKMKGAKGVKSPYRDVPTPEEQAELREGNFTPKFAPNADALIDYALSFIPKKTGKRGSREKKRRMLRWKAKQEQDAKRKKETHEAYFRKLEKRRKQNELCKMYRQLGQELREKMAIKHQTK